MNTIMLNAYTPQLAPCAATIGFFDGVHLGHQYLISQVVDEARRRGLQSAIITFSRHPRQVVQTDYVPQLITPLGMKLERLRLTNADNVVVLPFDEGMAALSARQFMRTVLAARLGVKCLVIGYDNRFGHNRSEGFADYVRYGAELGIDVRQAQPFTLHGMKVSSSVVRRLLSEGRVEEANRCMGARYTIAGRVERGFQEGRRLGFPTANIAPADPCQMLPHAGVYAARVSIEGGGWLPAMLNVGDNPTFGRSRTTLEAHIIGFGADIYGKEVSVELCRWIRGERRFGSAEELGAQLSADRQSIVEALAECCGDAAGSSTMISETEK